MVLGNLDIEEKHLQFADDTSVMVWRCESKAEWEFENDSGLVWIVFLLED